MNALADRQADFADALLGVEERCPDRLRVPPGLHERERFSVYRNNVAVGLIEALRSTFPVIERLVGDAFFAAMAWSYARISPPSSPVLLAYGAGFSAFITRFEPAMTLAYLADVARLEWQWVCAYHAGDAEPISLDALRSAPPESVGTAGLVLHPSVAVLSFAHPALSIWRNHQPGGPEPVAPMTYAPEAALVWRDDAGVQVTDIGPAAFRLLEVIRDGLSIGEAASAAFDVDADLDLTDLLRGLFQLDLFIGTT